MNKYTDYHLRKKKRKFISKKERYWLVLVGFLVGIALSLHFFNYTISPKNEVAMPKPSEGSWQDKVQKANGTKEAGNSAEFENASQSADWFIVPDDGASYVQ